MKWLMMDEEAVQALMKVYAMLPANILARWRVGRYVCNLYLGLLFPIRKKKIMYSSNLGMY